MYAISLITHSVPIFYSTAYTDPAICYIDIAIVRVCTYSPCAHITPAFLPRQQLCVPIPRCGQLTREDSDPVHARSSNRMEPDPRPNAAQQLAARAYPNPN